ncbi:MULTISPECIES: amidohydrolase [unclassified Sphingobacterium]|uniref:amidohydrolase n=1 Tax=unclassified Sphingobacterium TaxID=2609468 RepID=UPI0025D90F44|nr:MULTISPECIES: amidohydrolase [unclassified Sphingobacterium]
METVRNVIIFLFFLIFLGCKSNQQKGDVVYFGGNIVTMEADFPEVEALVLKESKIIFVGSQKEADNYIKDNTKRIDLKGKTLLPGFIDAHGHITSRAGMEQAIDLSPSPYGTVNSIPDLQKTLKMVIDRMKPGSVAPILGNGYDDAIMREHRHPTRQELDAVSTTHPIIVIHSSGHASVVNSAMLTLLNITENVKDPEGGHYGRSSDNRLNGKLEENASFAALIKLTALLPKPKEAKDELSQSLKDFVKAQDEWLSYGQTTICDGRSMGGNIELLKEAASKNLLKADVIYFPDFEANKSDWNSFKSNYMIYEKRLKFGGFKFSNDGSPQGKTAWLTAPYLVPPQGQSTDYKGFPIFSDEALYNDLKTIFSHDITAQLHVNGDAAIDQAIRVIEKLKNEGVYKPELRATLIHVQNSRPDHIAKIKKIGVIPSYFSSHVYLWGDWHYQSVFGPKRASFISPAQSAKTAGILFTIHHDSPVTPPDLMTGVYAAVNRITRSGMVLGPGERISVWDALKAITINAAYQYQEEKSKGSLKVGKLADLVILNQNPLTIDPLKLRDIIVVETIKEGKSVFKRDLENPFNSH